MVPKGEDPPTSFLAGRRVRHQAKAVNLVVNPREYLVDQSKHRPDKRKKVLLTLKIKSPHKATKKRRALTLMSKIS